MISLSVRICKFFLQKPPVINVPDKCGYKQPVYFYLDMSKMSVFRASESRESSERLIDQTYAVDTSELMNSD